MDLTKKVFDTYCTPYKVMKQAANVTPFKFPLTFLVHESTFLSDKN